MNTTFSTELFWQIYLTLESDDATDEVIATQCETLRKDFTVREEVVTIDDEEDEDELSRTIEFAFACGEKYSLLLEYRPDSFGSDRNLSLVDLATGAKSTMGWWDVARWHPYCLRESELDALLRYWALSDPRWPRPEVPLLLMCQFVGFADAESRDRLANRAAAAFQALGLPRLKLKPPVLPALEFHPQSRWENDPALGWIFTSDDYDCYSLRNRSHVESPTEGFPFAAFREMMTSIGER